MVAGRGVGSLAAPNAIRGSQGGGAEPPHDSKAVLPRHVESHPKPARALNYRCCFWEGWLGWRTNHCICQAATA